MQRSTIAKLAVPMLLAVVAASCGDDDEGSATTAPPTSAAASSTSVTSPTDSSAAPSSGAPPTTATDSAWDEVVAAAEDETELVIYTAMSPDQMDQNKKAFEAKYPWIELTYIRGGSGEMQPRFDQERSAKSGEADIYEGANPAYLLDVRGAGDLTPILTPLVSTGPFLEFGDVLRPADELVSIYAQPYHIAWNTDLVSEPILSYRDLIDRADEFRGQVAAPDLYSDSVATFYTHIEDGEGEGWLEEFLAIDPVLYDSGLLIAQAVAAGEQKAGIAPGTAVVVQLQADGAPIATALPPAESSHTAVIMIGIPKWAAHPNAAQLYIDYVLSPEGQEVAAQFGWLTVDTTVPSFVGGPDLFRIPRAEITGPAYYDAYRERFDAALNG